jgi:hypothetical protein
MSPPPVTPDALDPASARTERHLALLAELADIGMDLAREVRRQALDPSEDAPSASDLALTFSRVARAVRQTVALEARLAEVQPARPTRTISDRWRGVRRKRQVEEIVSVIIESEPEHEFDGEQLLVDLQERLADGDEEADFADRPLGEMVARICCDLGVAVDWSRFKDEDWAIPADLPSPAEREGEGRERAASASSEASPDPPWPAHDPPPGGSPH